MSELNELGRRVPELGRIELVQVRDVWQDEARDFTPWLKDNLRLLGEALGMELDALGRETPVGDFSLDILAQVRGTERKVAIENQLGKTDHSHLGQALTFDSLKAESEVIEAGFGASESKWVWDRQDNHRWACVGIRRDGSLNEPERWEELRAWVVEHLPRFQNVISSRLEKIIDGLETGAEVPVLGPNA